MSVESCGTRTEEGVRGVLRERVVEIEGEKCLKTIFLIVKNVAKVIYYLYPILVVKVLPYTTRHGSVVNQVAVSI